MAPEHIPDPDERVTLASVLSARIGELQATVVGEFRRVHDRLDGHDGRLQRLEEHRIRTDERELVRRELTGDMEKREDRRVSFSMSRSQLLVGAVAALIGATGIILAALGA